MGAAAARQGDARNIACKRGEDVEYPPFELRHLGWDRVVPWQIAGTPPCEALQGNIPN